MVKVGWLNRNPTWWCGGGGGGGGLTLFSRLFFRKLGSLYHPLI